MTLLQARLSDLFKSLTPTTDYTVAAARIVDGFESYFVDATVGAVGVASIAALAPCRAAMLAALLPAMAPRNNAAGAFQTGIVAWWGATAAASAAIWITVPVVLGATLPPSLGTIAAALAPVFAANRTAQFSRPTASDMIAATLHPLMLGGFVSQGPPPTTTPIL